MAGGKNASVGPTKGGVVGLDDTDASAVAPLLDPIPAPMTHLRTLFAVKPLAIATAAIDTPGCRPASSTPALNSGACLRRVRRPGSSISAVSMCPQCSYADTGILCLLGRFKMNLSDAHTANANARLWAG